MAQHKQKRGPKQFLQFGAVGFANAVIEIGALNLLLILFHTDAKGLLLLYNTIANALAIANSYYWNARITFKRSAEGNNRQRLLFIVQGLINLVVNNLVFLGVNELLEFIGTNNWLRYNVSKGLAMFLSFLASFFMVKYFVFGDYSNIDKKN